MRRHPRLHLSRRPHRQVPLPPETCEIGTQGLADQPACQNARGLTANGQPIEHLDVLIVGAGLSGIGAAHHLQADAARARATRSSRRASDLGGTWDLFRYPGIRSDSDMHTLGYRFRPWTEAQGDRRRRLDPRLRARDGARERDRAADPLRPPGRARRVVDDGLALDGRGRARRQRRDRAADLRASSGSAPATTATTRATRRSSRGPSASPARSSTRSTGPRTSTTPASGSS